MTSETERKAIEEAKQAAIEQTISQLRVFTGIPGYTPDPNRPEHLSYVDYEQELRVGRDIWNDRLRSSIERVGRAVENRTNARQRMDAEQQRRTDERAGSNVAGRLLGTVKDVTFPEKRDHAASERKVEEARQEQQRCELRVQDIDAELSAVNAWVEQMFSDVDRARAERQQLRNDEQLRREQAERDVSSRWCGVETPEAFVRGDSRRLARMQGKQIVLEGITLGHDWRRDGDDVGNGSGSWTLVWNSSNNEMSLELAGHNKSPVVWLMGTKITTEQQALDLYDPIAHRMKERNSLALVLDAYEAL